MTEPQTLDGESVRQALRLVVQVVAVEHIIGVYFSTAAATASACTYCVPAEELIATSPGKDPVVELSGAVQATSDPRAANATARLAMTQNMVGG